MRLYYTSRLIHFAQNLPDKVNNEKRHPLILSGICRFRYAEPRQSVELSALARTLRVPLILKRLAKKRKQPRVLFSFFGDPNVNYPNTVFIFGEGVTFVIHLK